MQLFPSPFSRDYWRAAAREVKNLRVLIFAALMIAASIVLGYFRIPVGYNLNLTVTFVPRAVAAMVGGPVVGLVFGFVEDILGWAIDPQGPFFPGYTLDTMLAMLVYAMCFYRQKLTVWRVIVAKVITNYPITVGLGVLWNSILSGKGYIPLMITSLIKNTAYLPLQVVLLVIVFQALIPTLRKSKLLPQDTPAQIPWH
ncbi:MAG: folate family ECF transporter S component [Clostridiales bacterium]|nr:folate family ECF transporter S component [Candidatus Cacconaster stercorequi]